MEITKRPDIGSDLKAPLQNAKGKPGVFHHLITQPEEGDIVLHWSQTDHAIVGSSVVVGEPWEDDISWADQVQPGIFRGLQGFSELLSPISLETIRSHRESVLEIRNSLKQTFGDPIYFPFVDHTKKLRAFEGYFVTFPPELLNLFGLSVDGLQGATPEQNLPTANEAESNRSDSHRPQEGGAEYRRPDETAGFARGRWIEVDPALVERGLKAHIRTQNEVADWLKQQGLIELSPARDDPNFDVAWWRNDRFFVCEVKSLTEKNEEHQLRLGLGQVLRYQQKIGGNCVAVLAAERKPSDPDWLELCDDLGVHLVWPGNFDRLLLGNDE